MLIYDDSDKKLLTDTQSQILVKLLKNKGEVVERNDILNEIWGKDWADYTYSESLNVFICYLRKCFKKDTSIAITNLRSIGYRIDF
jgi:DNA-binding response OmpR family regulator